MRIVIHYDRLLFVLARPNEVPYPIGVSAHAVDAHAFAIVRPCLSWERDAERIVDTGMRKLFDRPFLVSNAAVRVSTEKRELVSESSMTLLGVDYSGFGFTRRINV